MKLLAMMRQPCRTIAATSVVLGAIAVVVARPASAGIVLNGKSTWSNAALVATTTNPDSPTTERGTGSDRNVAQTFQVPKMFTIDKILIGYQNAVVDDTFTLRIFTVPDVNAAVDSFLVPEDVNYPGQVLLSEPVTLTGTTLEAGNVTSVLEFDLTEASQIELSASEGTAGYAFQIFADSGTASLAWQLTSSTQASIYDGGKFFELPTGGTKNDFSGRDSSLALVPVLVPGDFDFDGTVDGDDFALWQSNFPTPSGATFFQGDGDGDGDVDGADFVVWQTNYAGMSSSSTSAVPEPARWILSLMALAAGVFLNRSLRRSADID